MRSNLIKYGAAVGILATSFGALGAASAKASDIAGTATPTSYAVSHTPGSPDRMVQPQQWCGYGGWWDGGRCWYGGGYYGDGYGGGYYGDGYGDGYYGDGYGHDGYRDGYRDGYFHDGYRDGYRDGYFHGGYRDGYGHGRY